MKYKISIEGGFAGIPKEYTGEVDMVESEMATFLKVLGNGRNLKDSNIRDGFLYHIEVVHNGKSHKASYDDLTIPIEVRKLIDYVKIKR